MLRVRQLSRPGLAPFDLDLADGECVALSGPSGAGKTILLRAIADLDPNQGSVSLDGVGREAIPAPQWRARVCYLAAEAGWWADTVAAHFPDTQAAAALLVELSLPPEALGWSVSRASTGERQRLALARVLLLAPRVMLLDEPTSGLDPEAAARVEAILGARLERGAALLVVTHSPEQAGRMARRRLTMDHGRLDEGPP
ncbi:MAG: ABC transporter ATP-binding protein [Alphaproteobacteria bacterium]|nr:ABC transporter ATP-binding protein [Alphaproteobacteria bacterium]